jgi:hypothetical protein
MAADFKTAFAPLLQRDTRAHEGRQPDTAMRESDGEDLDPGAEGWMGDVLADETATTLQGWPQCFEIFICNHGTRKRSCCFRAQRTPLI